MTNETNLRDQVVDKFKAAFGEPEVSIVASGELYRWTLSRGPATISMFITIDSPEHSDLSHVLVSDGTAYQVDPLVTVTVYTLAEADALIERILTQWKSFPAQEESVGADAEVDGARR